VKSRLLGVVLNAVDASAPDYYYSYRYYPYSYAMAPRSLEMGHEEAPEHVPSKPSDLEDGNSILNLQRPALDSRSSHQSLISLENRGDGKWRCFDIISSWQQ